MIRILKHTPIILILILGIVVRTHRINRPLGDWHSWRQADTASVTRHYVQHGIDLLHPKYDDLGSIGSGIDNPEGYRMVEFPFVNAAIAYTYVATGGLGVAVHVFSRYFSIAFATASSLLIYLIVKKLVSKSAAIASAGFFALLPFSIFFTTTVLPENALVMFTLLSVWCFINYTDNRKIYHLITFAVSAALAMLLKPTYAFVAPALAYYYLKTHGLKTFKHIPLYLAAAAIAAPLLIWRQWVLQFPEGIPSYDWLFNSTNIRFKGAFFNWLFAERFGKWMLGYWGSAFLIMGAITKPSKQAGWFFHIWLLGMISYLFIFATGNVTHDYYQIVFLPIISIFCGLGVASMLSLPKTHFSRFVSISILPVLFAFTFAFSWFHIRDYFNINNNAMVMAGEYADKNLPKDALVITPYLGDTAFLYQTNRKGWPIGGSIERRIEQGADYYITTAMEDEAQGLAKQCRVIEQNDQFTVIDLSTCDFSIDVTKTTNSK